MPLFDAGATGLTGTIGVTILDSGGAVHVARSTAGITEVVAGSGVYRVAEHDADATLTYVWDVGVGTIGASETLYAGRESVDDIAAKVANLPTDPADQSAVEAAITAATSPLATSAAVGALNDLSAAEVAAELATYDAPTKAELDAAVAPLATAAALTVIDDLLDTEVAAIKAKTDTIGSLAVTVTSPVADSGTVNLYSGDDYDATHGRELSFAVADATHALGLDDPLAVVKLKASQATFTATSATSSAEGYTVVFEPTAAETALLTVARQSYELEATLADGDVVTLARGSLVVTADIPEVV